ncbi:hypothetical protein GE061_017249 [Apolygus lucorum]|uniref:Uncharacterized protein n=1 Tax=Apolygus lucorum TaxID=248454 RepID=A0A6A4J6L1_APOLU|nr:hypothetical protein GE061_017249 [Apolygus lucorum]
MQVCCRDSPMRDLYYFLLSSVRLEVRNQHIDQLLQAYVDSVKHYLLRLQYEGPIPDMGSIQEVFKKKKAYSLEFAITFVPIATGETQNIPDLETIAQAMAEAQEKGEKLTDGLWDVTSFLSTVGEAIVKDSMKKAMEYGII